MRWPEDDLEGDTRNKKLNLFIGAQNDTMRINYGKEEIDDTHENNNFRLCSVMDERVNHKINKCNKQAQKQYKTWLGEIIYFTQSQGMVPDHVDKW